MTPQDQQQQTPIQQVGGTETVREQDKIQLVLAYLPCLLSLIPLLTVKDSEFVKWHAKQGLVFGLALWLLAIVMQVVPVLGQLVGCLALVAYGVGAVMGILKAMKGERWRIPVVADLAEKF